MADSINNDNDASIDFADDLDAMLNDLDISDDVQDELIDDEDAIDQLIMKDVLDVAEEEITEELENEVEVKNEVDATLDSSIERAINQQDEDEKKAAENTNEFAEDKILDSVSDEPTIEVDVFAEIDEFTEEDNSPATIQEESSGEELNENVEITDGSVDDEPEPEESFDSILNEDFDISSEDDGFSEDEEEQKDEFVEEIVENEIVPEMVDSIETKSTAPNSSQVESSASLEKINSAIEAFSTQIDQLRTENETLKTNLEELVTSSEKTDKADTTSEDIEDLQKQQRKLRKTVLENQSKTPLVVYIVMGVAIFAVLVSLTVVFMNLGTQTEVDDVTELAYTLEEEIEMLTTNDISGELKKTNQLIQTLLEKNLSLTIKLDNLNKVVESNPLKTLVDDLVSQNDHAQLAIEQLLAKVDRLEKGRYSSAPIKKQKKIIKVVWVVNLVSFKQEWYAKRKAAEFEKKGVPTDVTQVKVNGQNWFRLSVKGFKSKYEAAAYAVKVKKTLNLSSVWVTKG